MEGSRDEREVLDELSMLADELLQQATEIRQQWSDLAEALGAELPPPPPVEEVPVLPRSQPQPAPPETDEADPVRLVALDMMLSGRSRDEVRRYLSATFGEGDREAVLDEIFTQYG
jgi:hypothetical protein